MGAGNSKSLAGIDMADALGRLGGNRALLEKVYADFCRQYADCAAEIGRLEASGNAADAMAMAHAVKGVAGNIGAKRIYAAARDLEAAFLSGGERAGLLSAFAAALGEVNASALAEPVAAPCGVAGLDRAEFAAQADVLRRLLQARDLDAEERFVALLALCPAGPVQAPLAALGAAVDALDYRSALDHLAGVERLVLGASAE
jgi:two-component system, sensor histidine kinase and response regulator